MNQQQQKAFENICKLAVETMNPLFGYWLENCSIRISVNAGHE